MRSVDGGYLGRKPYTVQMNSVITPTRPVPLSDASLLTRLFIGRVCAGFPSPAEDLGAQRIDLTQVLITHPQATYLLRARGHSMIEAGIFGNDILVVNRAITPRHKHIVVGVVDGDGGAAEISDWFMP